MDPLINNGMTRGQSSLKRCSGVEMRMMELFDSRMTRTCPSTTRFPHVFSCLVIIRTEGDDYNGSILGLWLEQIQSKASSKMESNRTRSPSSLIQSCSSLEDVFQIDCPWSRKKQRHGMNLHRLGEVLRKASRSQSDRLNQSSIERSEPIQVVNMDQIGYMAILKLRRGPAKQGARLGRDMSCYQVGSAKHRRSHGRDMRGPRTIRWRWKIRGLLRDGRSR